MKYRVIFTSKADAQLDRIYGYLSKEAGPEIAGRFTEDLLAYCYTLQDAPNRGTLYPHLYPGLRVIGFRRTVSIQFVVAGESVRILGITYRGQDYQRGFGAKQKG